MRGASISPLAIKPRSRSRSSMRSRAHGKPRNAAIVSSRKARASPAARSGLSTAASRVFTLPATGGLAKTQITTGEISAGPRAACARAA